MTASTSAVDLFETVETCPCCGSYDGAAREPFYTHDADIYLERLDVDPEHRVQFFMCESCDLVYQSPRWTPETADLFYAEKYRRQAPSEEYLKGKLQDGSHVYDWIHDTWTPERERPRVLDAGCAEGSTLKVFQAMVPDEKVKRPRWDAYGVEPTKEYAEFARSVLKVQVSTGLFDNGSWPGVRFDLVMAHHVIEHVHDPLKFLIDMRRKMRPGGRIYVGCPALDVPCGPQWVQVQRMDGNFFAAPHLFTFTSRTMTRLMNRAGLFVERLDHYERGMTVLARYARDGETNELCGRDDPGFLREIVERAREFERQYAAVLAEEKRAAGGGSQGA